MGSPDKRDQWGSKLDFILSCLGYAVGLGNVWRFPYLCGRNGGGVFLIPYGIMLLFAGCPTFYLELAIGQYSALTPHKLYRRMSPLFAGIGYSMVVISMYTGIYYNVIIAWSIRYLWASMTSDLPFVGCHHEWNTIRCWESNANCELNTTHPFQVMGVCRQGSFAINSTLNAQQLSAFHANEANGFSESSSRQYNNYVLGTRTFEDGLGAPKWDLVICLAISWVFCFLALCKGVKSSGKVVYFTATFPYLLLLILLIRGVLLEGAGEGIKFYITGSDTLDNNQLGICSVQDSCRRQADLDGRNLVSVCGVYPDYCSSPFEKLGDAAVWKDAANQIFFSLSLGGGGLTTLASYNQFNNNLLRDTLIVVVGNCATSIFAGFVIFPIIGYVAVTTNRAVSRVAAGGTALAFVVYPEGLARLSPPWLWSILFFFMLILLGIDSQLVIVEVVITAIIDEWPKLRQTMFKLLTVAIVSVVSFLIGLIFVTPQGKYLVTLVDSYAGGLPLVVCCLAEIVMVAWVYGVKRFLGDIRLMMGAPPNACWRMCGYPVNPYWWINWVFITPLLLTAILLFMVFGFERTTDDGYLFPFYIDVIGWIILISCCMWVPLLAIIQMLPRIVFSDNVNWGPLLNSSPEWRPAIETASKDAFALSSVGDGRGVPVEYGHTRADSSHNNYTKYGDNRGYVDERQYTDGRQYPDDRHYPDDRQYVDERRYAGDRVHPAHMNEHY